MILTILLWTVVPAFVILGVILGITNDIKHNNLGPKLNDWPRRKYNEQRDSHAKARQDGAFVDGMITGAVLDELDDMFK